MTSHHVVVDGHGAPLALRLSPANRHDSQLLEPALDAVPPLRGRRGRPRRRPSKLHGDKAYDHRFCRHACRRRGIVPRIALLSLSKGRRRQQRKAWPSPLGHRADHAWIRRLRRLPVRYERRADIHHVFAGALAAFQQLIRFC